MESQEEQMCMCDNLDCLSPITHEILKELNIDPKDGRQIQESFVNAFENIQKISEIIKLNRSKLDCSMVSCKYENIEYEIVIDKDKISLVIKKD